jgi:hypothetical protein
MGAVDEILRGCLAEATRDFIGIWEIIADIKAFPLDELQGSIKDRTMFIVNILLDSGFVAVDLSCSRGCAVWPDQSRDYVNRRIETEWCRLGREPNIGEVVYFWLPTVLHPVGKVEGWPLSASRSPDTTTK